jgi:DNA-binding MarR family transcriptional regulator
VSSRAPRPTILLDLFVAFQRSAQAVDRAFAEHQLDVPDFAILSTIGVEGPETATALARRLGMSQRTALFRVRRLEDAGLVVRQRSENDRREIRLSLSPAGEELRAASAPAFRGLITRIEERLDDPEAVRDAIRDLSTALEAELAKD